MSTIRRAASIGVLSLALAASGCKFGKSVGKSKGLKEENDPFGGSSLSELVLKVLSARLKAQAAMSDAQSALVVDKARAKLQSKTSGLRLTAANEYLNDYARFSGDMTVGAISSFVDPALGLKKRSEINNALNVIIGNTFTEMKGRLTNIDDPAFAGFIAALTKETVASLDDAGYESQDLDEAINTILKSAISNLKNAGILTDKNGAAVAAAIVQGAVMSLNSLGIGASSSLALQDDPTDPTVDSTTPAGDFVDDEGSEFTYEDYEVTAENIDAFDPTTQLKPVDEAKLEIDKPGADAKLVYAVILYKLMQGAVPALKDAGFTSEQIISVLKHLTFAMIGSLDDAGLDMFSILSVVDEGIYGALDALGSLKLETNETVKGLGRIAEGAVTSLKEISKFDDDKKHLIVDTVVYILSARATEIEGLKDKNLERAYETIISDATIGLKKAGLKEADFGTYAARILTIVMTSADQADSELDLTKLAQNFAAVVLASAQSFSKEFPANFKDAVKNNAAFIKLVGEGFDFDAWFDASKAGAEYLDYGTDSDPYGDPAISDPSVEYDSGISGETTDGETTGGETTAGETTGGETTGGETTGGETTGGETTGGETTGGETTGGETTGGETTGGMTDE